MALSGYNPEEVRNSINGVKNGYQELIAAIADNMQHQFVDKMATTWASSDAQIFFNESFKPVVDQLISESNRVFESVVNSMNSAALAWAQETNSPYAPNSFEIANRQMNVAAIMENIGGIRGIDLEQATAAASSLSTVADAANSALDKTCTAVQQCGFIGGNQSANLQGSLNQIRTNVSNAVREITAQVQQAINRTVQNYSNTEGQISAAFAGNR